MLPDDLFAELDHVVFDALADRATINGQPVLGRYADGPESPSIGRLKTNVVEPSLFIRQADGAGLSKQMAVRVRSADFVLVDVPAPQDGLIELKLRPA